MTESEIKIELWDLLNADSWLQNGIAATSDGVEVSIYDPRAVKFSIVGGMFRCYLEEGEDWSPLLEERRSALIAGMLNTQELKYVVTKLLKYTSTKKILLQELNKRVDYSFVHTLMQAMKKMKEG